MSIKSIAMLRSSSLAPLEIDIFSDKSSVILFWLLANHIGAKQSGFSINELSRVLNVSVGLVHKVIRQLEYKGIIKSEGLRTSKKFYLKDPSVILTEWVKKYSLLKKTKSKGYEILSFSQDRVEQSGLVPALHTAAFEVFHVKATNLDVQEYYLLNWSRLKQVEKQFNIAELERGHQLMLIKPYYLSLIEKVHEYGFQSEWRDAYLILTVLDLCHFPLRGIEQAEVLFRKNDILRSICPWSKIENAVG